MIHNDATNPLYKYNANVLIIFYDKIYLLKGHTEGVRKEPTDEIKYVDS